MRLLAPAKINLHLRVGGRRKDGFHEVMTWMCTVGLFDTLEIETARRDGVALTCDREDLPRDRRNLIVAVCQAWAGVLTGNRREEVRPPLSSPVAVGGIDVVLSKRIPIGGGLGGGSSDAARVLLGLDRLWKAGWSAERLARFAARYGSDLPFFFYGPSSICRGRGEEVGPVGPPTARWGVLILPGIVMSTEQVYRRFDELSEGGARGGKWEADQEPPWQQWAALGARESMGVLANDLEAAAFSLRPELGRLAEAAEQALGRAVRMSGSGSSLFSLYGTQEEAEDAAQRLIGGLGIAAQAVQIGPDFADDLGAVAARK